MKLLHGHGPLPTPSDNEAQAPPLGPISGRG